MKEVLEKTCKNLLKFNSPCAKSRVLSLRLCWSEASERRWHRGANDTIPQCTMPKQYFLFRKVIHLRTNNEPGSFYFALATVKHSESLCWNNKKSKPQRASFSLRVFMWVWIADLHCEVSILSSLNCCVFANDAAVAPFSHPNIPHPLDKLVSHSYHECDVIPFNFIAAFSQFIHPSILFRLLLLHHYHLIPPHPSFPPFGPCTHIAHRTSII